jgi:hypothetical protein
LTRQSSIVICLIFRQKEDDVNHNSPLRLIKRAIAKSCWLIAIAFILQIGFLSDAAYGQAACRRATWDPSDFIYQRWPLSDGNTIATDPNPGRTQNALAGTGAVNSGGVDGAYGLQPIPNGVKTQFEVVVGGVSGPYYLSRTDFFRH